jgi:flavin-binding protein dodecin
MCLAAKTGRSVCGLVGLTCRDNPGLDTSQYGDTIMTDHLYKVIELVGTSPESWERAATTVVEEAAKHLKDLRIGEVTGMDLQISDGKVISYRVKVKVSFKYHAELHEKS